MSNYPDRSLRDEDWNAVKKTLDILQESQHLVTHAQQAICPVNGFANEWSKLSDAHEAIKEAWYMIAVTAIAARVYIKRRTRDSNPQPLAGHLISSQAASQFAYPPKPLQRAPLI